MEVKTLKQMSEETGYTLKMLRDVMAKRGLKTVKYKGQIATTDKWFDEYLEQWAEERQQDRYKEPKVKTLTKYKPLRRAEDERFFVI